MTPGKQKWRETRKEEGEQTQGSVPSPSCSTGASSWLPGHERFRQNHGREERLLLHCAVSGNNLIMANTLPGSSFLPSLTGQSLPSFLVPFLRPSGSVTNGAIMYHGDLSTAVTYITLPTVYSLLPGGSLVSRWDLEAAQKPPGNTGAHWWPSFPKVG